MSNVELIRRFVPPHELKALLLQADAVLGVFGTTEKAARVVPCKVYDGLSAGLPVVTGDSPAARELLKDGRNALLVDRGDPDSLLRALRRLRDERGLAERMREEALRLAKTRFSREALGLRLRAGLRAIRRP
jgi:glycosyltransferase involved in cell wall biosynthesis